MSLVPGTLISKYVVRLKLAEGGMAELYLCHARGPEGFEKEVVIKRIRPALAMDSQFVQMFISEAKVASRLNHANLVHIFDFDKHEDTYYLAMEYVRGKSLWDLRRRCSQLGLPIPPLLAARIAAEVARGLHHAHRARQDGQPLNLVHRDVTPHNVLLSVDGAVKLTDFGIARAGTRLTAAGTLKGKFAYMAPEQARGEEVDARTDIFALGIVLWESVTSSRLFDDDSDLAVLKAVQERFIAAPARLNPDVSPALDAVIMKALSRDPAGRFQSAQEMERALEELILQERKSLEEGDVGAFLRKAYEGTAELTVDSSPQATQAGPQGPAGTAILRPARPAIGAGAPPLTPDEDSRASTAVLAPRAGEGSGPTQGLPAPWRRRLGWWSAAVAGLGLAAGLAVTLRRPMQGARTAVLSQPGQVQRDEGAAPDAGAALRTQGEGAPPHPLAAPAVKPPPATPGKPEVGYVVFRARPWSELSIDAHRSRTLYGKWVTSLSAGPHQLRFRGSRGGWRERTIVVDPAQRAEIDLSAPAP